MAVWAKESERRELSHDVPTMEGKEKEVFWPEAPSTETPFDLFSIKLLSTNRTRSTLYEQTLLLRSKQAKGKGGEDWLGGDRRVVADLLDGEEGLASTVPVGPLAEEELSEDGVERPR
jgi:hypothetical protein